MLVRRGRRDSGMDLQQLFLMVIMVTAASSQGWAQWGPWSCANTTVAQRTRSCTISADNCTLQTQNRPASIITWSSWSEWLPVCGTSLQNRTRNCELVSSPSAAPIVCQSSCVPLNTTQTLHRVLDTPIKCCHERPWSDWSPWLPSCSELNDSNHQLRTRHRSCPTSNNTVQCISCQNDTQQRTVSILQYSEWSGWSSILALCGQAPNRTRERLCQPLAPADYYCTAKCNSSQHESQCASVAQQWSVWSSWGTGCVGDVISRSRTCILPSPSAAWVGVAIFCNTSSIVQYDTREDSMLCASQRLQALLLPILATAGGVALICCLCGGLFLTLCCWERAKRKSSYDIAHHDDNSDHVVRADDNIYQLESDHDQIMMTTFHTANSTNAARNGGLYNGGIPPYQGQLTAGCRSHDDTDDSTSSNSTSSNSSNNNSSSNNSSEQDSEEENCDDDNVTFI